MFKVVCPRCDGTGEGDTHNKSILNINHDKACGYLNGIATNFNVQEVV